MSKRNSWLTAVRRCLGLNPATRDSDPRLYVAVCIALGATSATTLAQVTLLVERGDLPSYEYVSRARRAIQEDEPSLRGPAYNRRHKRAEDYRQDVRGTLAGTAASK